MLDGIGQPTLVARGLAGPFDDVDYPPGSLIGNFPWFKRKLTMWTLRMVADMAILLMEPEEKVLLGITRKPKLRFTFLVRGSFKLLSRVLRSRKGLDAFNTFIGTKVSGIFKQALELENSPGAAARAAHFVVPDPKECLFVHPNLVRNWPGSPAEYRLGGVNGLADVGLASVKAS